MMILKWNDSLDAFKTLKMGVVFEIGRLGLDLEMVLKQIEFWLRPPLLLWDNGKIYTLGILNFTITKLAVDVHFLFEEKWIDNHGLCKAFASVEIK